MTCIHHEHVRKMYHLPPDEGEYVVAAGHCLQPGRYTLAAALVLAQCLVNDGRSGIGIFPLARLDDHIQDDYERLHGAVVTLGDMLAKAPTEGSFGPDQVAGLGLEFVTWSEVYGDDLWAEFHESGACYDSDYERWLEWKYERPRAQR